MASEKSDNIRNYNRKRPLVKLGRLLGASALLLGSFKTAPLLSHRATANHFVYMDKWFAFVVANVIVLFVYHLSNSAGASSSDHLNQNTKQTSDEFHPYQSTQSVVTQDVEAKLNIDDNEAGIDMMAETFIARFKKSQREEAIALIRKSWTDASCSPSVVRGK